MVTSLNITSSVILFHEAEVGFARFEEGSGVGEGSKEAVESVLEAPRFQWRGRGLEFDMGTEFIRSEPEFLESGEFLIGHWECVRDNAMRKKTREEKLETNRLRQKRWYHRHREEWLFKEQKMAVLGKSRAQKAAWEAYCVRADAIEAQKGDLEYVPTDTDGTELARPVVPQMAVKAPEAQVSELARPVDRRVEFERLKAIHGVKLKKSGVSVAID
jgi:hypothetical protein